MPEGSPGTGFDIRRLFSPGPQAREGREDPRTEPHVPAHAAPENPTPITLEDMSDQGGVGSVSKAEATLTHPSARDSAVKESILSASFVLCIRTRVRLYRRTQRLKFLSGGMRRSSPTACRPRPTRDASLEPWQGDETDAVLDKMLRCCVQRALDTCACCRNAARRLRFLHDRMELDHVCEQSSVLRCLLTM